jgi:hypothetical protein
MVVKSFIAKVSLLFVVVVGFPLFSGNNMGLKFTHGGEVGNDLLPGVAWAAGINVLFVEYCV